MKQMNLKKVRLFPCLLFLLLLLQLAVNIGFGSLKQGFHYDEYYSYYSSNVTYRLLPTDREWKDVDEIRSEFAVLPGGQFQYPMVVLMQTFDVHPPVYYLLLHTVCSFFPGVFSKWTGIGLNLFFFSLCFLLLAWLSYRLSGGRKDLTLLTCMLFGLNPGVISGVTFIRMYLLLTVFLFLLTCIHASAIRRGKLTFLRFYLPLTVTVYLGFLTHYYFFVYLFMLAFAFAFWMFFRGGCVPAGPKTEGRSSFGRRFSYVCRYGLAIAAGLALAVGSYPASLSHIFRGYRGTGAASAFFDLSNTGERLSFFLGLLNEFVFGGCLPALLLLLALLLVTAGYLRRRKTAAFSGTVLSGFPGPAVGITAFAVAGYFLVVAKTALMTAEEANRYEQPVYGLILLLALLFTDRAAAFCHSCRAPRLLRPQPAGSEIRPATGSQSAAEPLPADSRETAEPQLQAVSRDPADHRSQTPSRDPADHRSQTVSRDPADHRSQTPSRDPADYRSQAVSRDPADHRSQTASWFSAVLTAVTAAVLLAAQITGLASGKVLFLYQGDTRNYAFAKEHKDDTVLYYYNNDLQWMIWDDSLELMQYQDIYFVDLSDPSPVTDPAVTGSQRLIVYAMRSENTRTALENLPAGNFSGKSCKKIGKRLYCDVYEIT